MARYKHGFSLVELSIVLVILGLLVGGILTGQSLIRAAEMRSVATEFKTYQTAGYTFKDKYLGLPGDLTNATDFWGAQASGHSACIALDGDNPASGTETCNGNGDGTIGNTTATNYEDYRFWQQLANAGLVEGTFTGVTSDTADSEEFGTVIGSNVPASKFPEGGWFARHYSPQDISDTEYFPGKYGNTFQFGSSDGTYTRGNILMPEEAWNIDQKVDDGRPAYGKVLSRENASSCITSTDPELAEYAVTDTSQACHLIMVPGF